MQYSATELKGAGTPIKNILLAGDNYTFIIYRPPNETGQSPNLSGSGYFTYETVRDENGFYSPSISPLALGTNVAISGSNTLIGSPYIFSYELNTNSNTPYTSSFTFTPDVDVPVGDVMFRATGDYDMYVSPEVEACGIAITYDGGPNYPTHLESILGTSTGIVTLTANPFSTIPDRWVVTWDGNFGSIDTGYISPSTLYGLGGNSRATFNSSLIGRIAPEGGTYPLPPGGTAPNIIESDGYPRVNITPINTQYTFTKTNSTSITTIDIYAPTPGTLWTSTLSCPTASSPYVFLTKAELQTAVDLWVSDRAAALGTYGEINTWNVSAITNMSDLFFNKTDFNDDISNWVVSNVTNMQNMFNGASSFDEDITIWDVSSVTNMSSMFIGAIAFNRNIGAWNMSQVENMSQMFNGATSFNQNLNSWDVSSVTTMQNMFNGASTFNGDISSWNVSSVADMIGMFNSATSFNQDLNSWNVSSVTNMDFMFQGAQSFNQDLNSWDVSSVIDMRAMFDGATIFNGNIIGWDVSSVTDMKAMFAFSNVFNKDIGSWDVSSVNTMQDMFVAARAFNQDLNSWDVSSVTNMQEMFNNATDFDGNISSWDVSSVTNMVAMFQQASIFNQDISSWDVSSVTDMSSMFNVAYLFDQNISSWDVSSVTRLSLMFRNATAFNQDISTWDVSSVINTQVMFYLATSFNQDLSTWDVSNVNNMDLMFLDSGLSTVNYSNALIGWSALGSLEDAVPLGAGTIQYSAGAAATARGILTSAPNNWTITDGGQV